MAVSAQGYQGVQVENPGIFRASTALLFLNLLDGVFTTAYLQLNLAVEANPLMRWAYSGSPLAFMGLKLLAVQGGVVLLWRSRERPLAQWAMTAGAYIYGALVLWHLAFAARLALS